MVAATRIAWPYMGWRWDMKIEIYALVISNLGPIIDGFGSRTRTGGDSIGGCVLNKNGWEAIVEVEPPESKY